MATILCMRVNEQGRARHGTYTTLECLQVPGPIIGTDLLVSCLRAMASTTLPRDWCRLSLLVEGGTGLVLGVMVVQGSSVGGTVLVVWGL